MSGLAGHLTRDSGDTRGKVRHRAAAPRRTCQRTMRATIDRLYSRAQGPADVETQLADLQRKYRILEARARVPRRRWAALACAARMTPASAGQPQGLLRGCPNHHPPPARRHREAAGGEREPEARA